jgi:catechol 2,3-dioxygenase-like lactoylglutathione lyase family enzyme
MIRAIDIVTIPVRDQNAALKFYTEKLGFKVATNQDFGDGKQRWIELLIPGAESRIALFTPEGFENRIGGFQPVTFRCDDVYATAEALKSRGVKLAADPILHNNFVRHTMMEDCLRPESASVEAPHETRRNIARKVAIFWIILCAPALETVGLF